MVPWNFSSGNGAEWHSRHNPVCRLATMFFRAPDRLEAPVSEAGMASPTIT